jgi:hypothetical protein
MGRAYLVQGSADDRPGGVRPGSRARDNRDVDAFRQIERFKRELGLSPTGPGAGLLHRRWLGTVLSGRSRSPYDARPSLSAAAVAPVTRNVDCCDAFRRICRSDASSTALSGFGLKLEHHPAGHCLAKLFAWLFVRLLLA